MFQLTMQDNEHSEQFVTTSALLTNSLFKEGVFVSEVNKCLRDCRQYSRVRVYRNLNKPSFYSIMAMEGERKGRVCGYAKSVQLESFKFIVNEKPRLKILKEKRRSVHAFCDGIITDASNETQHVSGQKYVTYNPYFSGSFFEKETKEPVKPGVYNAILQGAGAYLLP